jgi:hypothetical protein
MHQIEKLADRSLKIPDLLDFITFDFRGVTFRVRGVLHGVTGGASRDYIDFVKRSIKASTGFVMVEKNMSVMYGTPNAKELDDWLVLRFRDVLVLSCKFYFIPRNLIGLVWKSVIERLRRQDPFIKGGQKDSTLIGGSPLFHHLDPMERRAIAGFPLPLKGLRRHLSLRAGEPDTGLDKAIVPHGEWTFLNSVEQQVSIPIRSLHMLFFAWSYAVEQGHKEVDLFIGETHNTDVAVIAENADILREAADLNPAHMQILDELITQAVSFAKMGTYSPRRLARYALYLTGMTIPILGVIAVFSTFAGYLLSA